jgi:signal transduction histidine kinase
VIADPADPQLMQSPTLELDRLIDQLVDRVAEERSAKPRFKALLHALAAVSADLGLDRVLDNVVGAASSLLGAEAAAFSLASSTGRRRPVTHTAADDSTLAVLTALARGAGPTASLLETGQPVRWSTDELSALAVPVRLDGENAAILVVGNCQDPSAGFDEEDQDLLLLLAAAAGIAIAHARRYDEAQVEHGWLRASTAITQDLLSADDDDPLEGIAAAAFELAHADLVTVALLTGATDEVVVEVARGEQAERVIGLRVPLAGTVAGIAVAEHRPLLVHDYLRDVEAPLPMGAEVDTGAVMVVPLLGRERVWGVLGVSRTSGQPGFTVRDLSMAAAFANHATVALELAEVQDARQRMRVLEDRDRIARDLHDHVIQQLFAIGLSLEGTASDPLLPAATTERIRSRVEDIDRTIRRVRTSIFALRGTLDHASDELRASIIDISSDLTPILGFAPQVTFSGAPGALPTRLVDDVAAVVREGLTNVARHAQASSVTVDLTVTAHELVVSIDDNGVGMPAEVVRSGTANVVARATRRGGTCTIEPGVAAGTLLTWRVPLP